MAAALRFTYLPILPSSSPSPTPTFAFLTTSTVLAADRAPSMTSVLGLRPRAVSFTTVYIAPTPSATASASATPEKPKPRDPVYGDLTWSYVALICVPFVFLAVALYTNHRDRRRRLADQDIEMQPYRKYWFPWRELDPGEVPNEIYGRTGALRNADPAELTNDDDVAGGAEAASDSDSIAATTGRASPDISPKTNNVRGDSKTNTPSPNPWTTHIPSYYGNLPFPVSPVSTLSPPQDTRTGTGSNSMGETQVQAEMQTNVRSQTDRGRGRFDFSSSEDEADGQPAEPQHSYYADPSTRAGKQPVKP